MQMKIYDNTSYLDEFMLVFMVIGDARALYSVCLSARLWLMYILNVDEVTSKREQTMFDMRSNKTDNIMLKANSS